MNKDYKKEVISYGDCKAELYNDECLEVMDYLISNNIKVDSIICDPPYG